MLCDFYKKIIIKEYFNLSAILQLQVWEEQGLDTHINYSSTKIKGFVLKCKESKDAQKEWSQKESILKTHLGTAVAVKANIGTFGRWLLKDESLR